MINKLPLEEPVMVAKEGDLTTKTIIKFYPQSSASNETTNPSSGSGSSSEVGKGPVDNSESRRRTWLHRNRETSSHSRTLRGRSWHARKIPRPNKQKSRKPTSDTRRSKTSQSTPRRRTKSKGEPLSASKKISGSPRRGSQSVSKGPSPETSGKKADGPHKNRGKSLARRFITSLISKRGMVQKSGSDESSKKNSSSSSQLTKLMEDSSLEEEGTTFSKFKKRESIVSSGDEEGTTFSEFLILVPSTKSTNDDTMSDLRLQDSWNIFRAQDDGWLAAYDGCIGALFDDIAMLQEDLSKQPWDTMYERGISKLKDRRELMAAAALATGCLAPDSLPPV